MTRKARTFIVKALILYYRLSSMTNPCSQNEASIRHSIAKTSTSPTKPDKDVSHTCWQTLIVCSRCEPSIWPRVGALSIRKQFQPITGCTDSRQPLVRLGSVSQSNF